MIIDEINWQACHAFFSPKEIALSLIDLQC